MGNQVTTEDSQPCKSSSRPSRVRPSPSHLRRQAARGWPHPERLQYPEGVDSSPCPASAWWSYRAFAQGPCLQVQLREDDLPKVLRPSATTSHQLPQAEVRSQQPAPPKEEDQISVSPSSMDMYVEMDISTLRNECTSWYGEDGMRIKCYHLQARKGLCE